VKKVLARIGIMLLLVVLGGTAAYAGTTSTKAQKQAQKQWQKYARQQAKIQKRQMKQQNKAAKKWNKDHATRHVT
jgi:hypothetical protein